MKDLDQLEWKISINWNGRSRSIGMEDLDQLEWKI